MRQHRTADYAKGNRLTAGLILASPSLYAEGSLGRRWAALWQERHGAAQQQEPRRDGEQMRLFAGAER